MVSNAILPLIIPERDILSLLVQVVRRAIWLLAKSALTECSIVVEHLQVTSGHLLYKGRCCHLVFNTGLPNGYSKIPLENNENSNVLAFIGNKTERKDFLRSVLFIDPPTSYFDQTGAIGTVRYRTNYLKELFYLV